MFYCEQTCMWLRMAVTVTCFKHKLTNLFKHLVAFIQNKMLGVLEIQSLLSRQRQDPARCSHDDVGAVGLEDLLIFLDANSAEEHSNLDIIHVLTKPLVFFVYLESQLTCMAHNQHANLAVDWLQLL